MVVRPGHTAVARTCRASISLAEFGKGKNIYEPPYVFRLVSHPESSLSLGDIRIGPVRPMADWLRGLFFLTSAEEITHHTPSNEWFLSFLPWCNVSFWEIVRPARQEIQDETRRNTS